MANTVIKEKSPHICGKENKVHGGPCKRSVDKAGDKCWQHAHKAKTKTSAATLNKGQKKGLNKASEALRKKSGTYVVTKESLKKIIASWDGVKKALPNMSYDSFFQLLKGEGFIS